MFVGTSVGVVVVGLAEEDEACECDDSGAMNDRRDGRLEL